MLLDSRHAQIFPTLNEMQFDFALRFATSDVPTKFGPNETVFEVGDRDNGVWLVNSGSIVTSRRDGLRGETDFATIGQGQFTGEVSDLGGQASLAVGRAGSRGCTAYPFDGPCLRALVVGSAEIGELIMRAFILRRAVLLEGAGGGSVILGAPGMAETVGLRGFMTRNSYPHTLVDAECDDGKMLVERLGVKPDDLPLVICPNGSVLRRPTTAETGIALGITPKIEPDSEYDVVVVGAGPAGLAAAVYAASEGLSVLVVDSRSFGGQAGASSRIENYFGFPTGITGQALTARAFIQATKFGAQFGVPLSAISLDCSMAPRHRIDLNNGVSVYGHTVVVASGAKYRRLDVTDLTPYEGKSVSYWATPIEASVCQGRDVALIGGGNSAGQAAVYLAPQVRHLYLVVRGDGLEASMSKYLVDRIAATPNIELLTRTEVNGVVGTPDGRLQKIQLSNRDTRRTWEVGICHLFLFIGAEPNSSWLDQRIALDDHKFVLTGGSPRAHLETSSPGVFAIGDVRARSVKRVAAGVGEGAAVVAQIHAHLAFTRATSMSTAASEIFRSVNTGAANQVID